MKLTVSQLLFSEWPHTQKYVDSTDWSCYNIKFNIEEDTMVREVGWI